MSQGSRNMLMMIKMKLKQFVSRWFKGSQDKSLVENSNQPTKSEDDPNLIYVDSDPNYKGPRGGAGGSGRFYDLYGRPIDFSKYVMLHGHKVWIIPPVDFMSPESANRMLDEENKFEVGL